MNSALSPTSKKKAKKGSGSDEKNTGNVTARSVLHAPGLRLAEARRTPAARRPSWGTTAFVRPGVGRCRVFSGAGYSKKAPSGWRSYLPLNNFLDQDTYLLATQQQEHPAEGGSGDTRADGVDGDDGRRIVEGRDNDDHAQEALLLRESVGEGRDEESSSSGTPRCCVRVGCCNSTKRGPSPKHRTGASLLDRKRQFSRSWSPMHGTSCGIANP